MSNAIKALKPQLEFDLHRQGYDLVIGIDEAGRGPLAGPVVASAVCLKSFQFQIPVTDSKKLNSRQRHEAFLEITRHGVVGIGMVNETVIDQVNILQATFLAMNQAVRDLLTRLPPQTESARRVHLLVDGNRYKCDQGFACQTIVDGDAKVLSIACASIVAKVIRDRMLDIYDRVFPDYGFAAHKGYGTAHHRDAIVRLGLTSIHRKTFQGCIVDEKPVG